MKLIVLKCTCLCIIDKILPRAIVVQMSGQLFIIYQLLGERLKGSSDHALALYHHTLDEWCLPHCFYFVSFPSQVLFLGQPRKLIRDTASYPHFRELMKVSHHVLELRGSKAGHTLIITITMDHSQTFPFFIMCKLLQVRSH